MCCSLMENGWRRWARPPFPFPFSSLAHYIPSHPKEDEEYNARQQEARVRQIEKKVSVAVAVTAALLNSMTHIIILPPTPPRAALPIASHASSLSYTMCICRAYCYLAVALFIQYRRSYCCARCCVFYINQQQQQRQHSTKSMLVHRRASSSSSFFYFFLSTITNGRHQKERIVKYRMSMRWLGIKKATPAPIGDTQQSGTLLKIVFLQENKKWALSRSHTVEKETGHASGWLFLQ